jgi:hypothetical protein
VLSITVVRKSGSVDQAQKLKSLQTRWWYSDLSYVRVGEIRPGALFRFNGFLWMVESLFEKGYNKFRAELTIKKEKNDHKSLIHACKMNDRGVLTANELFKAIYYLATPPATANEIAKYYLCVDVEDVREWDGLAHDSYEPSCSE